MVIGRGDLKIFEGFDIILTTIYHAPSFHVSARPWLEDPRLKESQRIISC